VKELRGRTALITGAGGGLGGYIARSLAAEGVNLALTDLPGAPVDGLAAELRPRGVEVKHAPADLTDREDRRRLMTWAEEAVGPLDILVNNAGVEFAGEFLLLSEEEIETMITVNLVAVMHLTRLALPGMLERRRGHIVNVASLAGKAAFPFLVAYSGTKHGVVGFTHALRMEHRADPVGFSAICPGFVGEAGLFGRFEEEAGKPPFPVGVVAPERVSEAVVRSIRRNLPEVIVNRGPARPLVLMAALFPATTAKLLSNKRIMAYGRRFATIRRAG
jgi:short-subunit dehydrogenase